MVGKLFSESPDEQCPTKVKKLMKGVHDLHILGTF